MQSREIKYILKRFINMELLLYSLFDLMVSASKIGRKTILVSLSRCLIIENMEPFTMDNQHTVMNQQFNLSMR